MVEVPKQTQDNPKKSAEAPSGIRGMLDREPTDSEEAAMGGVVLEAANRVGDRITSAEIRAEDESRRAESAEREAREDPLTEALNRRGLKHEVDSILENSELDPNTPVTVRAFDIDDFKKLNDEFGHEIGDTVLRVLTYLIRTLHPNALVARMGGDEFVSVQIGEDNTVNGESYDDETTIKNVLYEKILEPFIDRKSGQETIEVEGLDTVIDHKLVKVLIGYFNCSVGQSEGSLAGLKNDGVYSLIEAADQGMYEEKSKKDHFRGRKPQSN